MIYINVAWVRDITMRPDSTRAPFSDVGGKGARQLDVLPGGELAVIERYFGYVNGAIR
jgi:hypothetical protein